MNKEYTDEQMQRSRAEVSQDTLGSFPEYLELVKMLHEKGRFMTRVRGADIISLLPEDFDTVEQKIGMALFASACFQNPMSLNGVSLIDFDNSRVNIAITEGNMIGFWGEKFANDPFGRTVYYIDIVGVLSNSRTKGLGGAVGRACLSDYIGHNRRKDIVIVTRTQNPMMVGALKNCLPEETDVFPFVRNPNYEWIQTVNWLVGSGFVSRNSRKDSWFDANRSLIHWGAYGHLGDGSTWENMIAHYMNEIDWSGGVAAKMLTYMHDNGTSLQECLIKGHAFIVGSYISGIL